MLLTPATISIPQIAVQQLVCDGYSESDRQEVEEAELPALEDGEKKKKKKRKKTKRRNAQTINEAADMEEEEAQKLDNQTNPPVSEAEVSKQNGDESEAESADEDDNHEQETSGKTMKKKKKKKKKTRLNKNETTDEAVPSTVIEHSSSECQTKMNENPPN